MKVIDEVNSSDRKDLATKEDIARLELKLELKIESTKSELGIKIESTKSDIIKWVAAMLVAQAGVMAALIRLFGLLK